jgi:hypothetical protein
MQGKGRELSEGYIHCLEARLLRKMADRFPHRRRETDISSHGEEFSPAPRADDDAP